jgi:DNA-nicking Smr family endonuclease
MNRRRKAASEEETALFRSALHDARPLKARARVAHESPKLPRIFVPLPHFPSEPRYNEVPPPAIGGHADAHLRRGRLEPEARLDLHGLTQNAAYRALLRFLAKAQAEGKKLVLVITGKGGILRAQLPLWLGEADLQTLVAGLGAAHVKHGGAGAFYVLLRKHSRVRPR